MASNAFLSICVYPATESLCLLHIPPRRIDLVPMIIEEFEKYVSASTYVLFYVLE